jgi:hypothetical protein
MASHAIGTLNVAGPRSSSDPDLYALARSFLQAVLRNNRLRKPRR